MTSSDEAPAIATDERGFWAWFDTWCQRAGEYLNPILVKETRQAFKSRQFVITFSLVLLCGWVWSVGGLVLTGALDGSSRGREMFAGYFFILGFPLLVMVPFGAFRSLAAEWEDNTYELLSISALKPHQIVSGKLGSSLLQIVLYLSALAPCLAFTYLLRGIDLPTIVFLLFWMVVNSITVTLLGLCLATISRARHWQVVYSVALIAGCLWNYGLFCGVLTEELVLRDRIALYMVDPEFWVANGIIFSAAVGYGALFFLIARAALLFPSENRSTALRICLVVQYLLFLAWAFWGWLFIDPDLEVLMSLGIVIGLHWWGAGAFLIGERPELSKRARRRLPQSFLGRMFWTTFNPGSGTGYLFVLGNLASAVIVLAAAPYALTALAPTATPRIDRSPDLALYVMVFLGLGFCYVTIYLGIGRLIILAARRFTEVSVQLAMLVQILLVLVGTLGPMLLQAWFSDSRGYTILQISNLFWTLEATFRARHTPFPELPIVVTVLPFTALVVLLLNVRSVGRELRQLRVDAPQRVQEEDALLHPSPQPEPYRSPWDEDEPAARLTGAPDA